MVLQLASSVVLALAAGLLIRSLIELNRIDLGFDSSQVLTAQLQVPATEGRLAMEALIDALRNGTTPGDIDPFEGLPGGGVITQENASEFTGEWVG